MLESPHGVPGHGARVAALWRRGVALLIQIRGSVAAWSVRFGARVTTSQREIRLWPPFPSFLPRAAGPGNRLLNGSLGKAETTT